MHRALLVIGLLLLGCQQRSGSTPAGPPPVDPPDGGAPAAPQLSLTVADGGGGAGPFRIGSLEYLKVEVSYTGGARGPHALRLDVVDPRGTAYAHVPATLLVGESGAATATKVVRVRGTD